MKRISKKTEDTQSEDFKRGMELAWKTAQKIKYMSPREIKEVFHTSDIDYLFCRFTAEEAVKIIRDYESKKGKK